MKLLPLAALVVTLPLLAQEKPLAFEPKVGAIGAQVSVKGFYPQGAEVRFGPHVVGVLREPDGFSFIVPGGATTGFIEVVRGGRVVSKTAVPFVVTGTSLVNAPRIMGLKEAIDVFGYSESVPEGAKVAPATAKPVLKLDDEDVLTIGEPAPSRLAPAVQLGDAASAATSNMGPAGFLITARPPKKRYQIPAPSTP